MGRWAPNITEKQRRAVTAAMLEGRTAGEVVRMAAAGELPGCGPFSVSETTARDLRQEAEREPQKVSEGTDPVRATAQATIDQVSALGADASNQDLARLRTAQAIIRDADRHRPARRREEHKPAKERCVHVDGREDCDCEHPCFTASLCRDVALLEQAEAEGRPRPCLYWATEDNGPCYHCGAPPAAHERHSPDHERLHPPQWHTDAKG